MLQTTQETACLEAEDNKVCCFTYLLQWEWQNWTSICTRKQFSLFRNRVEDIQRTALIKWERKHHHNKRNVSVQLTVLKLTALERNAKRPLSLQDYPSPAWTVRGTPKDRKDLKPLFYLVIKICDSVSSRTQVLS